MNPVKKNSVLQIGNYKNSAGGISTQIENLVSNLKKENIRVQILSTRGTALWRLLVSFRLLIGYNSFAVYHVHGCSGYGFFPILLGVFAGVVKRKRIIVTYHGGMADAFLQKRSKVVKRVLANVAVVTVMSEYLRQVFEKYGIETVIVPNTFIPVKINRIPIQRNALQAPVIVSTRALSSTYNILSIIKAYRLVKAEFKDAELVILGDGPERNKLEDFVTENGIMDVQFIGAVNHEDIYGYISQGTVFVSVSMVDNQPFSILEAFFCGVPVVASNVGGVPDMVTNNTTGILVEPLDLVGIVDGIKKLHKNIKFRNRIISEALEEVNKYCWPDLKDSWMRAYNIQP